MWILRLEDARQRAMSRHCRVPARRHRQRPTCCRPPRRFGRRTSAGGRRWRSAASGSSRRRAAGRACSPIEPDPEVRQMAAFALGLIGDASGADALIDGAGDPDPLVQGAGRRSARADRPQGRRADAIAAMMTAHIKAGALDGMRPTTSATRRRRRTEAVRLGTVRAGAPAAFDAARPGGARRTGGRAAAGGRSPTPSARRRPAGGAGLLALLQGRGAVTRAFAARGLGAHQEHALSAPAS